MISEHDIRRILHSVEPPALSLPAVVDQSESTHSTRGARSVWPLLAALSVLALLIPVMSWAIWSGDESSSLGTGGTELNTCGPLPSVAGPHSDAVSTRVDVPGGDLYPGDSVSATITLTNVSTSAAVVISDMPGTLLVLSPTGEVVGLSVLPVPAVGAQHDLQPGDSAEVPASISLKGCPLPRTDDPTQFDESTRVALPAGTYYLVGIVLDLPSDGLTRGVLVSAPVQIEVLPAR